MTNGIVIIGAGHAGSQLAASLKQEFYQGPVTLVGTETDFPYHRPPLSKAFLKAADDRPQPLRAESFYTEEGVTFLKGLTATRIAPEAKAVTLDDGRTLPYDKLVLATGARPRWPKVPGADLDGVVVMRTLTDARSIRQRLDRMASVVVLGGGFVGLETAATLKALGKDVTVLEIAPRILGRAVAPQISDHVLGRLRDSGIAVTLGTGVTAIDGRDGAVSGVTLSTGGTLPADLVLVGIGVEPETDLAEAAGLSCDNGVLIDGAMRSSNADIFAIGDCARYHHWQAERQVRLESVQNATDHARLLARILTGKEEPYRAVPWFWSDIGDMKLQMVGLSFDADEYVTVGDMAANAFSIYHFCAGKLVAIDSINKPADHMTGRRLLASDFKPSIEQVAAGDINQVFKSWQAANDGGQATARPAAS